MDLTGKEFGRWKVIKYSGNKKWLEDSSVEDVETLVKEIKNFKELYVQ